MISFVATSQARANTQLSEQEKPMDDRQAFIGDEPSQMDHMAGATPGVSLMSSPGPYNASLPPLEPPVRRKSERYSTKQINIETSSGSKSALELKNTERTVFRGHPGVVAVTKNHNIPNNLVPHFPHDSFAEYVSIMDMSVSALRAATPDQMRHFMRALSSKDIVARYRYKFSSHLFDSLWHGCSKSRLTNGASVAFLSTRAREDAAGVRGHLRVSGKMLQHSPLKALNGLIDLGAGPELPISALQLMFSRMVKICLEKERASRGELAAASGRTMITTFAEVIRIVSKSEGFSTEQKVDYLSRLVTSGIEGSVAELGARVGLIMSIANSLAKIERIDEQKTEAYVNLATSVLAALATAIPFAGGAVAEAIKAAVDMYRSMGAGVVPTLQGLTEDLVKAIEQKVALKIENGQISASEATVFLMRVSAHRYDY